jgi:DNA mismatch repair protein MutL
MSRIKVLDEKLANQIAAGEVVERPSSVVKELVENAIDAGSTTIDVYIEEGGLTLIRVVDNGGGIDPDDLPTAFARHATSKISSGSDLFRIASLGFRGEALASIAAVSRLSAISANSDSGLARKLVIEGGTIVAEEPANAPQGTEMSVRDLFYNTPARLKYMKSIQTELGHISDYINRVALAHPGIAVTLKHNGSSLLQTLGTGDRLQVIAAVYGSSTAKAMLPISASDPDFELTGYVSKPELTRANRNGITLVVNGRYIRSFAVNASLQQAYHTLLPINRFPLAVLEVEMHPSLLDVNVHPSKMEVRFSKEAELKALIEKAVKAALGAQRYIPGPDSGKKQPRSGPLYVQESIAFHIGDRLESSGKPSGPASPADATDGKAPGAAISGGSLSPFRQEAQNADFARDRQIRRQETDSTQERPFGSQSGSNARDRSLGSQASSYAGERSPYIPRQATEKLYAPPRQDWGLQNGIHAQADDKGLAAKPVSPAFQADTVMEARDIFGSEPAQRENQHYNSTATKALGKEAYEQSQGADESLKGIQEVQGVQEAQDVRDVQGIQDVQRAQDVKDVKEVQELQEVLYALDNAEPYVIGAGAGHAADAGEVFNAQAAFEEKADLATGKALDGEESSIVAEEPESGGAPSTNGADASAAASGFPELHWIGQHHGTYIVAQADDGLYLIDQHAAHERINYEYYLYQFGHPAAESQGLLVPLTLEFTPGEAMQLRDRLELFQEAGVDIEPFGAQTFLVRAYPQWLPHGEEKAVLEEMAELLIAERKSIDIGKLREKAAIMCACKASIKANDRMTREEGDVLLARLAGCSQPYTCPHGRPIIVHLSTYQLEKMFKRVMS